MTGKFVQIEKKLTIFSVQKLKDILQILRTFNCFISLPSSITSFVPCTLISMASFKFSSNLIVAAAWNMMLMLEISVCLSVSDRPNPASEQSPAIVTIL